MNAMRLFAVPVALLMLVANATLLHAAQTIKRGTLKGERVSWTQGSVNVVKMNGTYTIQLGSNFKTKSGPALYVYLGNGKPEKRIGKLKATEGSQTYKVPGRVDPSQYSNIYIYCVPFNAIFGSASIR